MLVATDIVSRGIDVDAISHVINYELPNAPEDYVHRIGRTARAGSDGIAISFCDTSERTSLRSIERFLGRTLTQVGDSAANGQAAAQREAVKRKAVKCKAAKGPVQSLKAGFIESRVLASPVASLRRRREAR